MYIVSIKPWGLGPFGGGCTLDTWRRILDSQITAGGFIRDSHPSLSNNNFAYYCIKKGLVKPPFKSQKPFMSRKFAVSLQNK